MSRSKKLLRALSFVLLQTFIVQQLAWASPEPLVSKHSFDQRPEVSLKFPASVATIEDAYKNGGNKLIYLIQDAHTNESGQYNLSSALDIILNEEKDLKLVFTEAGVGDNSLSFLRPHRPLSERTQIAKKFIRKGLLHGAEYLDLTSSHSFTLWGVENPKLYIQAIEDYRAVAKERERLSLYLKKIDSTLTTLKDRLLNPSLNTFSKERKLYHKDELPLTTYFQVLLRESELNGLDLKTYPHLKNLKDLKDKEEAIDFSAANQEHVRAVQALSADIQKELKDLTESSKNRADKVLGPSSKEEMAYFALLEEKLPSKASYPQLSKYFDYLTLARTLNAKEVLSELKALEERILELLSTTQDEKDLMKTETILRSLEKLFTFTLTPEEFKEYRSLTQDYSIKHLTGFLNKKIMDLETYYERALFLEESYNDILKHAEGFYTLTTQRDEYFLKEALSKMDKDHQSKAVLITGGFHTTNLKEMLQSKGISYISITPQVLHETNLKRYESLLIGTKNEWAKLQIAAPSHAMIANLVSAMNDRISATASVVAGAGALAYEMRAADRKILPSQMSQIWPYDGTVPTAESAKADERVGARLSSGVGKVFGPMAFAFVLAVGVGVPGAILVIGSINAGVHSANAPSERAEALRKEMRVQHPLSGSIREGQRLVAYHLQDDNGLLLSSGEKVTVRVARHGEMNSFIGGSAEAEASEGDFLRFTSPISVRPGDGIAIVFTRYTDGKPLRATRITDGGEIEYFNRSLAPSGGRLAAESYPLTAAIRAHVRDNADSGTVIVLVEGKFEPVLRAHWNEPQDESDVTVLIEAVNNAFADYENVSWDSLGPLMQVTLSGARLAQVDVTNTVNRVADKTLPLEVPESFQFAVDKTAGRIDYFESVATKEGFSVTYAGYHYLRIEGSDEPAMEGVDPEPWFILTITVDSKGKLLSTSFVTEEGLEELDKVLGQVKGWTDSYKGKPWSSITTGARLSADFSASSKIASTGDTGSVVQTYIMPGKRILRVRSEDGVVRSDYYTDMLMSLMPRILEQESSQRPDGKVRTILDMGTGRGTIGIAAGLLFEGSEVIATDVNPNALPLAASNAKLNGVTNFETRQGSLTDVLRPTDRIDVAMITVPTTIVTLEGAGGLSDVQRMFLDGGSDGRMNVDRIIETINPYLADNASMYITISSFIGVEETLEKLRKHGFEGSVFHRERKYLQDTIHTRSSERHIEEELGFKFPEDPVRGKYFHLVTIYARMAQASRGARLAESGPGLTEIFRKDPQVFVRHIDNAFLQAQNAWASILQLEDWGFTAGDINYPAIDPPAPASSAEQRIEAFRNKHHRDLEAVTHDIILAFQKGVPVEPGALDKWYKNLNEGVRTPDGLGPLSDPRKDLARRVSAARSLIAVRAQAEGFLNKNAAALVRFKTGRMFWAFSEFGGNISDTPEKTLAALTSSLWDYAAKHPNINGFVTRIPRSSSPAMDISPVTNIAGARLATRLFVRTQEGVEKGLAYILAELQNGKKQPLYSLSYEKTSYMEYGEVEYVENPNTIYVRPRHHSDSGWGHGPQDVVDNVSRTLAATKKQVKVYLPGGEEILFAVGARLAKGTNWPHFDDTLRARFNIEPKDELVIEIGGVSRGGDDLTEVVKGALIRKADGRLVEPSFPVHYVHKDGRLSGWYTEVDNLPYWPPLISSQNRSVVKLPPKKPGEMTFDEFVLAVGQGTIKLDQRIDIRTDREPLEQVIFRGISNFDHFIPDGIKHSYSTGSEADVWVSKKETIFGIKPSSGARLATAPMALREEGRGKRGEKNTPLTSYLSPLASATQSPLGARLADLSDDDRGRVAAFLRHLSDNRERVLENMEARGKQLDREVARSLIPLGGAVVIAAAIVAGLTYFSGARLAGYRLLQTVSQENIKETSSGILRDRSRLPFATTLGLAGVSAIMASILLFTHFPILAAGLLITGVITIIAGYRHYSKYYVESVGDHWELFFDGTHPSDSGLPYSIGYLVGGVLTVVGFLIFLGLGYVTPSSDSAQNQPPLFTPSPVPDKVEAVYPKRTSGARLALRERFLSEIDGWLHPTGYEHKRVVSDESLLVALDLLDQNFPQLAANMNFEDIKSLFYVLGYRAYATTHLPVVAQKLKAQGQAYDDKLGFANFYSDVRRSILREQYLSILTLMTGAPVGTNPVREKIAEVIDRIDRNGAADSTIERFARLEVLLTSRPDRLNELIDIVWSHARTRDTYYIGESTNNIQATVPHGLAQLLIKEGLIKTKIGTDTPALNQGLSEAYKLGAAILSQPRKDITLEDARKVEQEVTTLLRAYFEDPSLVYSAIFGIPENSDNLEGIDKRADRLWAIRGGLDDLIKGLDENTKPFTSGARLAKTMNFDQFVLAVGQGVIQKEQDIEVFTANGRLQPMFSDIHYGEDSQPDGIAYFDPQQEERDRISFLPKDTIRSIRYTPVAWSADAPPLVLRPTNDTGDILSVAEMKKTLLDVLEPGKPALLEVAYKNNPGYKHEWAIVKVPQGGAFSLQYLFKMGLVIPTEWQNLIHKSESFEGFWTVPLDAVLERAMANGRGVQLEVNADGHAVLMVSGARLAAAIQQVIDELELAIDRYSESTTELRSIIVGLQSILKHFSRADLEVYRDRILAIAPALKEVADKLPAKYASEERLLERYRQELLKTFVALGSAATLLEKAKKPSGEPVFEPKVSASVFSIAGKLDQIRKGTSFPVADFRKYQNRIGILLKDRLLVESDFSQKNKLIQLLEESHTALRSLASGARLAADVSQPEVDPSVYLTHGFLENKVFVLRGAGAVAEGLILPILKNSGTKLIVTERNQNTIDKLLQQFEAFVQEGRLIFLKEDEISTDRFTRKYVNIEALKAAGVDHVDILIPAAQGPAIFDEDLEALRVLGVKAIAGSENDVLSDKKKLPKMIEDEDLGIVLVPDFVGNPGGVRAVFDGVLPNDTSDASMRDLTAQTTRGILLEARRTGKTAQEVAEEQARRTVQSWRDKGLTVQKISQWESFWDIVRLKMKYGSLKISRAMLDLEDPEDNLKNPKRFDGIEITPGVTVKVYAYKEEVPARIRGSWDGHYAVFQFIHHELRTVSYAGIHGLLRIKSDLPQMDGRPSAIGGTRMQHYEDGLEAFRLAMELPLEMALKNATAGLEIEGSKNIINPPADVEADPRKVSKDQVLLRNAILVSDAKANGALQTLLGGKRGAGVLVAQDANISRPDHDLRTTFAQGTPFQINGVIYGLPPSERTSITVYAAMAVAAEMAFDRGQSAEGGRLSEGGVLLSPDRKYSLLLASGTVLEPGTQRAVMTLQISSIGKPVFSPDSRRLAVFHSTTSVYVFNLEKPNVRSEILLPDVNSLDHELFMEFLSDRTLRVYTRDGKQVDFEISSGARLSSEASDRNAIADVIKELGRAAEDFGLEYPREASKTVRELGALAQELTSVLNNYSVAPLGSYKGRVAAVADDLRIFKKAAFADSLLDIAGKLPEKFVSEKRLLQASRPTVEAAIRYLSSVDRIFGESDNQPQGSPTVPSIIRGLRKILSGDSFPARRFSNYASRINDILASSELRTPNFARQAEVIDLLGQSKAALEYTAGFGARLAETGDSSALGQAVYFFAKRFPNGRIEFNVQDSKEPVHRVWNGNTGEDVWEFFRIVYQSERKYSIKQFTWEEEGSVLRIDSLIQPESISPRIHPWIFVGMLLLGFAVAALAFWKVQHESKPSVRGPAVIETPSTSFISRDVASGTTVTLGESLDLSTTTLTLFVSLTDGEGGPVAKNTWFSIVSDEDSIHRKLVKVDSNDGTLILSAGSLREYGTLRETGALVIPAGTKLEFVSVETDEAGNPKFSQQWGITASYLNFIIQGVHRTGARLAENDRVFEAGRDTETIANLLRAFEPEQKTKVAGYIADVVGNYTREHGWTPSLFAVKLFTNTYLSGSASVFLKGGITWPYNKWILLSMFKLYASASVGGPYFRTRLSNYLDEERVRNVGRNPADPAGARMALNTAYEAQGLLSLIEWADYVRTAREVRKISESEEEGIRVYEVLGANWRVELTFVDKAPGYVNNPTSIQVAINGRRFQGMDIPQSLSVSSVEKIITDRIANGLAITEIAPLEPILAERLVASKIDPTLPKEVILKQRGEEAFFQLDQKSGTDRQSLRYHVRFGPHYFLVKIVTDKDGRITAFDPDQDPSAYSSLSVGEWDFLRAVQSMTWTVEALKSAGARLTAMDEVIANYGGNLGAAGKAVTSLLNTMLAVNPRSTKEDAEKELAFYQKHRPVESVFPGINYKFLKGNASNPGASTVVLDLEDAVAVPLKPGARRTVALMIKLFKGKVISADDLAYLQKNALMTQGLDASEKGDLLEVRKIDKKTKKLVLQGYELKPALRFREDQKVIVRPNNLRTPWAAGDFAYLIREVGDLIHGVYSPKVFGAEDVRIIVSILRAIQMEKGWRVGMHDVHVLIEDPRALLEVGKIMKIAPEVIEAQFGIVDYTAASGGLSNVQFDQPKYARYAFLRIIEAANEMGKIAGTGVTVALEAVQTAIDAVIATAIGMNAKWAIGPNHIAGMDDKFDSFPRVIRKNYDKYEKIVPFDLKKLDQLAETGAPILEPEVVEDKDVEFSRAVVRVSVNDIQDLSNVLHSKADMIVLESEGASQPVLDAAATMIRNSRKRILIQGSDFEALARLSGEDMIRGIFIPSVQNAQQVRDVEALLNRIEEKNGLLKQGHFKIAVEFTDLKSLDHEGLQFEQDKPDSILHASDRVNWAFLNVKNLPKEILDPNEIVEQDKKTKKFSVKEKYREQLREMRGYNYYHSLFRAMAAKAQIDAITGYSEDWQEDAKEAAIWGFEGKLATLEQVDKITEIMTPQRNLFDTTGKSDVEIRTIWGNSIERALLIYVLYAYADNVRKEGAIGFIDPVMNANQIVDAATARIPQRMLNKAYVAGLLTEREKAIYLEAKGQLSLALKGVKAKEEAVVAQAQAVEKGYPASLERNRVVISATSDANSHHADLDFAQKNLVNPNNPKGNVIAHGIATLLAAIPTIQNRLPDYGEVVSWTAVDFMAPVPAGSTVQPPSAYVISEEEGKIKIAFTVSTTTMIVARGTVTLAKRSTGEQTPPLLSEAEQEQAMAAAMKRTENVQSFPQRKIVVLNTGDKGQLKWPVEWVGPRVEGEGKAEGTEVTQEQMLNAAALEGRAEVSPWYLASAVLASASFQSVPVYILRNAGVIKFGVPIKVGDKITVDYEVAKQWISADGRTDWLEVRYVARNQAGEVVMEGFIQKSAPTRDVKRPSAGARLTEVAIPEGIQTAFFVYGLTLESMDVRRVQTNYQGVPQLIPIRPLTGVEQTPLTLGIGVSTLQALTGSLHSALLSQLAGAYAKGAGQDWGKIIDSAAVVVGRKALEILAKRFDVTIIVGGNEGSFRDASADLKIGLVINPGAKKGTYYYFGDSVEVTNGVKRAEGRPGTSSMILLVKAPAMPSTDGYRISMAVDLNNPKKPFPQIDPVITSTNTLEKVLTQLASYMDEKPDRFIRRMASQYKLATLNRPKHDQLKAQARELGFEVVDREDGDPLLFIRAAQGIKDSDGKKLLAISTGGANEHIMAIAYVALNTRRGSMFSTYASTEALKQEDVREKGTGRGSLDRARDFTPSDLRQLEEVNKAVAMLKDQGLPFLFGPADAEEAAGQILNPRSKELAALLEGDAALVISSNTGANELDWGVLSQEIKPVTWSIDPSGSARVTVSGFFIAEDGGTYFYEQALHTKDAIETRYRLLAANIDMAEPEFRNPLFEEYDAVRRPLLEGITRKTVTESVLKAYAEIATRLLKEEEGTALLLVNLNAAKDASEIRDAVLEIDDFLLGIPSVTMEDGRVHKIVNTTVGARLASSNEVLGIANHFLEIWHADDERSAVYVEYDGKKYKKVGELSKDLPVGEYTAEVVFIDNTVKMVIQPSGARLAAKPLRLELDGKRHALTLAEGIKFLQEVQTAEGPLFEENQPYLITISHRGAKKNFERAIIRVPNGGGQSLVQIGETDGPSPSAFINIGKFLLDQKLKGEDAKLLLYPNGGFSIAIGADAGKLQVSDTAKSMLGLLASRAASAAKHWAQYVYGFGAGRTNPRGADIRDWWGNKMANSAEMDRLGFRVPPGFVIETPATKAYFQNDNVFPAGLWEAVLVELTSLEAVRGKKFGDSDDPLLVSVRSSARVSMPGMMDTILNVGVNDRTVEGLAAQFNDRRFAYDSYRRLLMMFGSTAMGATRLSDIFEDYKSELGVESDADLTAEQLQVIIHRLKAAIVEETGREFPQNPREQLYMAIEAVFRSSNSDRAKIYRKLNNISPDIVPAVGVQSMVFGNLNNNSATGVGFTRDPNTGRRKFKGEFLINAQGEDVVAGIRPVRPAEELEEVMPAVYAELMDISSKLEAHFRDAQDIEFTVENGVLYMLQTRSAKRSAAAMVHMAVEMAEEGLITWEEALRRLDLPKMERELFHRTLDKKAAVDFRKLTTGVAGSPGAGVGLIVFNSHDAVTKAARGPVVLVREETSPEDIEGMHAAKAIVTARGGMTSHAAVVARGQGTPAVVGADELHIDAKAKTLTVKGETFKEGTLITIDGTTGDVYLGEVPTVESEIEQVEKGIIKPEDSLLYQNYSKLLLQADQIRRMGVWANADTPEQALLARKLAQGIGLARTEHMFSKPELVVLVQAMFLAEEGSDERRNILEKIGAMQREDFEGILEAMQDLPVTIRLLDPPIHEFLPRESDDDFEEKIAQIAALLKITPEKVRQRIAGAHEINPMLGSRGVRLLLMNPSILKMQVRAMVTAYADLVNRGVKAHLKIMVPNVMNAKEFAQAKALIQNEMNAVLSEKNVAPENRPIEIGVMIETPAAALTAGEIAKEAAFFSFGTNDLTQGTMMLSRDDAARKLLPWYIEQGILEFDPTQRLESTAVYRLVQIAVAEGRGTNPDLSIGCCGEAGGEPNSILLFDEAGLSYVSASIPRLPIARLAAAQATLRAASGARLAQEDPTAAWLGLMDRAWRANVALTLNGLTVYQAYLGALMDLSDPMGIREEMPFRYSLDPRVLGSAFNLGMYALLDDPMRSGQGSSKVGASAASLYWLLLAAESSEFFLQADAQGARLVQADFEIITARFQRTLGERDLWEALGIRKPYRNDAGLMYEYNFVKTVTALENLGLKELGIIGVLQLMGTESSMANFRGSKDALEIIQVLASTLSREERNGDIAGVFRSRLQDPARVSAALAVRDLRVASDLLGDKTPSSDAQELARYIDKVVAALVQIIGDFEGSVAGQLTALRNTSDMAFVISHFSTVQSTYAHAVNQRVAQALKEIESAGARLTVQSDELSARNRGGFRVLEADVLLVGEIPREVRTAVEEHAGLALATGVLEDVRELHAGVAHAQKKNIPGEITVLLDDEKRTLLSHGLEWKDASEEVLVTRDTDSGEIFEITPSEVHRDGVGNIKAVTLSIADLWTAYKLNRRSINADADALLKELGNERVGLELNVASFGDILRDSAKLKIALLEAKEDIQGDPMRNVTFRFTGSDRDQLAIQEAKNILSQLAKEDSSYALLAARFVDEHSEDALLLEVTTPQTFKNAVSQKDRNYVFIDTSIAGPTNFATRYFVAVARGKVKRDEALHEGLRRLAERVLGFNIDSELFKEVTDGLEEDIEILLSYSVRPMPVDPTTWIQLSRNMLSFARSA